MRAVRCLYRRLAHSEAENPWQAGDKLTTTSPQERALGGRSSNAPSEVGHKMRLEEACSDTLSARISGAGRSSCRKSATSPALSMLTRRCLNTEFWDPELKEPTHSHTRVHRTSGPRTTWQPHLPASTGGLAAARRPRGPPRGGRGPTGGPAAARRPRGALRGAPRGADSSHSPGERSHFCGRACLISLSRSRTPSLR
jgi:hypothetical protein